MNKLINMKKELIEKGVRKAKHLTTEEFLDIVAKRVKKMLLKEYDNTNIAKETINGKLMRKILNGEFSTENKPDNLYWFHHFINSELCNDIEIKHGYDGISNNIKLITIKDGLPGLLVIEGSNYDDYIEEYPLAMFVYSDDGKKLRVYTPKYGNFFNRDTKSPIGSGWDGEDDLFILNEIGEEIPQSLQNMNDIPDDLLSYGRRQLHSLHLTLACLNAMNHIAKLEQKSVAELEQIIKEIGEDAFVKKYAKEYKAAFKEVNFNITEENYDNSDNDDFEVFSSIAKLDSTKPQETALIEAISCAISITE